MRQIHVVVPEYLEFIFFGTIFLFTSLGEEYHNVIVFSRNHYLFYYCDGLSYKCYQVYLLRWFMDPLNPKAKKCLILIRI
jgi:hypothetical protein